MISPAVLSVPLPFWVVVLCCSRISVLMPVVDDLPWLIIHFAYSPAFSMMDMAQTLYNWVAITGCNHAGCIGGQPPPSRCRLRTKFSPPPPHTSIPRKIISAWHGIALGIGIGGQPPMSCGHAAATNFVELLRGIWCVVMWL
jgi:hypothetical protein